MMVEKITTDSDEYASRLQFYSDELPSLLERYLSADQWQTCLELGCGDGSLLSALNNRGYLAGKAVYALDISANRLGNVQTINADVGCVVADAGQVPIETGSIDFAISTQVIEHVPDDAAMVKELHRMMGSGRILYLATIFKKWYGWYFYRCNGKWVIDPTHVREYTDDRQLTDILTENGFEILENHKTRNVFPLIDAVIRRVGGGKDVYNNRGLRTLRKIRLPIPGYYIWEVVCRKK
jgi:2-polyprenyl-3-methyl-5-hydroxy-6-metoxy-1,4-benzoquinol methylase